MKAYKVLLVGADAITLAKLLTLVIGCGGGGGSGTESGGGGTPSGVEL